MSNVVSVIFYNPVNTETGSFLLNLVTYNFLTYLECPLLGILRTILGSRKDSDLITGFFYYFRDDEVCYYTDIPTGKKLLRQ